MSAYEPHIDRPAEEYMLDNEPMIGVWRKVRPRI
jgi:hypothetical protein